MFLMFADKHSNPQQKANNIPRKPRDNQSITVTPPSQQKSETKGISKPITKGSAKSSKAAVATIQSDSVLKPSNMCRDIRKGEPQTVFNTQLSDRLTGEITVMENETKAISKVDVLLDTGAETSFIDSSLAAKLHLPVLEHKTIRLHTFGTKETKQEKCALVRLKGWDDEGTLHSLDLLTYEVLTRSFSSLQVSIEDQSFLNSLDISLPIRKDKKFVKPLILHHLWSFMRCDKSAISLPSGLYLLPTKLGPIISGKAKSITSKTAQSMTSQLIQVFPYVDDISHWDSTWSMDDASETQVNMIRPTVSDITEDRIGQIAIISDVEKAFLKVRLQEVDRDATRCLWFRDHNSPPTLDNIQTFRFTRVTFGIKSSPFLLAGTTYYHLDNHTEEAPLCERRSNLRLLKTPLILDKGDTPRLAMESVADCVRTTQEQCPQTLTSMPFSEMQSVSNFT
ncbi:hypothetical protein RB195_018457 [Necator americanus]|uniref:Tas retrotransposon peptidase A16 n=1 Tax=Necator americanus TaxID=51031 RepID=A0ABR1C9W6_NECAM